MNIETKIELWDSHKEESLKDVVTNELTVIFAVGIINPFGPTLNVIAIDGKYETSKELPVIHLMLNPFSQEVKQIGIIKAGDSWPQLSELFLLLKLPIGSCPTVLLISDKLKSDAINFASILLTTFNDGFSVLEKVRKFPGDPWNRVQQDVNDLEQIFKKFQAGDDVDEQEETSRPLTNDEAYELASNLLKPTNQLEEIKAFLLAWGGSIRNQGGRSSSLNILPYERFLIYFSLILSSCNIDLSTLQNSKEDAKAASERGWVPILVIVGIIILLIIILSQK